MAPSAEALGLSNIYLAFIGGKLLANVARASKRGGEKADDITIVILKLYKKIISINSQK